MRTYSVLLNPDPEYGGFTVTVPALPGVITEGDTLEEALANAKEAIECAFAGGEELDAELAPFQLTVIEVDVPPAPIVQLPAFPLPEPTLEAVTAELREIGRREPTRDEVLEEYAARWRGMALALRQDLGEALSRQNGQHAPTSEPRDSLAPTRT
jgi:predicted RNase H-like HicB family nuclease